MDDIIAAVAEAAGCPANVTVDENVVCLEKVDAQKLVNVSTEAWQGSGPSLGGLVSENVFERIASKRYPDIPTVVSSCRDEGTSSAIGFKADNDDASALGVQSEPHWLVPHPATGRATLIAPPFCSPHQHCSPLR